MILAIDVGNTTIQGGLFNGEKLALQFRRMTNPGVSSDEFGIFLRAVLRENGFDPADVTEIACCSVVPSINHSLANTFTKYFGTEALFIQAGIRTRLKLKYANPKEIGADRIAAALGALSRYPDCNLIIIDMGTATTIDVVTKSREYLGGAILPGLKISVGALASGTAKLPQVEIVRAHWGRNIPRGKAVRRGDWRIRAAFRGLRHLRRSDSRTGAARRQDRAGKQPIKKRGLYEN